MKKRYGRLKEKIRSGRSILPKYLLTYIIMLVLPVCIISIVVYQFNLRMYRSEITENAVMNLKSIRQVMDEETDELFLIATQVFSNKELQKADRTHIVDTMVDFKEELMNYAGVNHFIKDIAVYYPDIDYVFGSSGASDFSSYANILYNFNGYNADGFREYLKNCPGVAGLPVSEYGISEQKCYAYIIKETNLTSMQGRVIFAFIDTDYIRELTDSFTYDVYIFDKESNLITENNSKYGSDFVAVSEYSRNSDGAAISKRDNGFYICSLRSDETAWQYIMAARYGAVFGDIMRIQVVYIILLILITALGICIMYYSINSFYKPINKLKIRLSDSDSDSDDIGVHNEIETVQIQVDRILAANSQLEDKVDKSYAISRDFMLYKLINASMENDRLREKFKFYGVNFDHDFYYIAVFHIDNLEPDSAADILGALKGFVEKYDCVTTNVFEHNKLCIILPSSGREHDERNKRLVSDLQQFLEQLTISSISVGVGNPVSDISKLWKSYVEAQNAFGYLMLRGRSRIIFFDDTNAEGKTEFTPVQKEKLENYIKAGERQRALDYVDEIIAELSQSSVSVAEVKYVCFELAFLVINVVSELSSQSGAGVYRHFDLAQIVEFDTVSGFSKNLKRFMNGFFDSNAGRHDETDDLIDKILTYIHENYNKPYFSVDNIADKFGFSNTYLSQYFKSKKMITISNYIAKVQIDEAKKLLIQSDWSIKDIAEEIGYSDVSNFIRRFKAKTGVTPGIYRKTTKKIMDAKERNDEV